MVEEKNSVLGKVGGPTMERSSIILQSVDQNYKYSGKSSEASSGSKVGNSGGERKNRSSRFKRLSEAKLQEKMRKVDVN